MGWKAFAALLIPLAWLHGCACQSGIEIFGDRDAGDVVSDATGTDSSDPLADVVSDPATDDGSTDVGSDPDVPEDPITDTHTGEDTVILDNGEEETPVNPYEPLELIFDNLATAISSATSTSEIICTTLESMPTPTTTRRGQWEFLLRDIIELDTGWTGVVWWRADAYGFTVFAVRDPEHGDYVVVLDDDSCEGIYVFDMDTTSRLIVQVPYPVQATGTLDFGIELFQEVEARVLMIAGADRCMDASTLTCDGRTRTCSGGSLEQACASDAGLNLQLIFQTVHTLLHDQISSSTALQIHDVTDATSADIIVSDGTRFDGTFPIGLSVQLTSALELQPDLIPYAATIVSCNNPSDVSTGYGSLCGEANVQGRRSNGSTSPCGTAATASSDRFVIMELSSAILGSPACEDAVIAAVDSTF